MKILIVEDHPLIQEAWRMALGSWQPGVEVTQATTRQEALGLLQAGSAWGLALIDLQLPDGSGLDVLAAWRECCGDAPAVIVSANDAPTEVLRALQAGARGFLSKVMGVEGMLQGLQDVLNGSVALPPLIERPAADAGAPAASRPPPAEDQRSPWNGAPSWLSPLPLPTLAAREAWPPRAASVLGPECQRPSAPLTPRQREVLDLLLQGKPNKLIARQLNLSVETVKDHVAALLRVLGVRTRLQAALLVNTQSAVGSSRHGG